MKKFFSLNRAGETLLEPREYSNGIHSFLSWKFYLVFALYAGAFLVFAHDPFFHRGGIFVYQQGAVTLFLAYVVVGAVNWEFNIFGKSSGANLLLQIMQILPFSLFLARLLSSPSGPPASGSWKAEAVAFVTETFSGAISVIPAWLRDFFCNWESAVLLLLILLFFCFRSVRLKVAFLLGVLVYLTGINIINGSTGNLFLGMLLFAGGLALQFCRYDRVVFFENAVRRVADCGAHTDRHFAAIAMKTVTMLYEKEQISRDTFLELVHDEYSHEPDYRPEELYLYAGEVMRQMVYRCGLVEIKGSSSGFYLKVNPLLGFYDNLLSCASVLPRLVLVLAISVIWIILPIDVIPDAIPFFGVLDDVSVAVLSAMAVNNSVR